MNERRPIMAIVLLTACVMLPGAYVGGYFATVRRNVSRGCFGNHLYPTYTIGNKYAQRVFAPLYKLDRSWRPSYWDAELFFDQQFLPVSAVRIEYYDPWAEDEERLGF